MNISLHSFSDALILFITGLKKKKKRGQMGLRKLKECSCFLKQVLTFGLISSNSFNSHSFLDHHVLWPLCVPPSSPLFFSLTAFLGQHGTVLQENTPGISAVVFKIGV